MLFIGYFGPMRSKVFTGFRSFSFFFFFDFNSNNFVNICAHVYLWWCFICNIMFNHQCVPFGTLYARVCIRVVSIIKEKYLKSHKFFFEMIEICKNLKIYRHLFTNCKYLFICQYVSWMYAVHCTLYTLQCMFHKEPSIFHKYISGYIIIYFIDK